MCMNTHTYTCMHNDVCERSTIKVTIDISNHNPGYDDMYD